MSGGLSPALTKILFTCINKLSKSSQVLPPGSNDFDNSWGDRYYWANNHVQPAFVVRPGKPQDISVIMMAIADACEDDPDDKNKLRFAVKGGGHFANPGTNSTEGGILIDLVLLDDINFDLGTKTVEVGPGQIWTNVYKKLRKTGYNVNGATQCPGVGVAGFLLGGGFGHKTNQYGLAIDNIDSIDVVLPNGDYIQEVSDKKLPKLFQALKGGGNNFGIITKWRLPTHAQSSYVCADNLIYQPQHFDELANAIVKYNQGGDVRASVEAAYVATCDESGAVKTVCSVELFFDGPPKDVPEELFKDFYLTPHGKDVKSNKKTSNTIPDSEKQSEETHSLKRTMTWMERLEKIPVDYDIIHVDKDDLPGFRGRFSSVMVSKYTKDFIDEVLKLFNSSAQKMPQHSGISMYADVWPFNSHMYDKSRPCAWPHSKGNPSGPLVLNFKWVDEKEDGFWIDEIRSLTEKIRKCALDKGLTTEDTPAYYNLSIEKDVQAKDIYQGNMQWLGELRSKYDPHNVMGRTGGFRIPAVPIAKSSE